MQRRSWRTLATVRKVLTCAVCSIALVALFSFFKVPNFSDTVMLPTKKGMVAHLALGIQKLFSPNLSSFTSDGAADCV